MENQGLEKEKVYKPLPNTKDDLKTRNKTKRKMRDLPEYRVQYEGEGTQSCD